MLYYIYGNGGLVGFHYNNNTYYYHKNIFNDIIGIFDSNFNEIVTYEYDSWGAIVNVTDNGNINLGTINPFRYRSYYYDEKTGLYYLNSRYYSPTKRRFLNADSMITGRGFNGNNVFTYCGNNSIIRVDNGGDFWFTAAMTLVGAAIGTVSKIVENVITGNENILEGVGGAVVAGALNGFVASNPFGAVSTLGNIAINVSIGITQACVDTVLENKNTNYLIENSIVNSVGNLCGGTLIETNPYWFRPEKLTTILFGKYSTKTVINMTSTTAISTGASIVQKNYATNQSRSGSTCQVSQNNRTEVQNKSLRYNTSSAFKTSSPYSSPPYLCKNQYDMLRYIQSTKTCLLN